MVIDDITSNYCNAYLVNSQKVAKDNISKKKIIKSKSSDISDKFQKMQISEEQILPVLTPEQDIKVSDLYMGVESSSDMFGYLSRRKEDQSLKAGYFGHLHKRAIDAYNKNID